MTKSHFSFIDDVALRTNLDVVFDHIVELTTISDQYKSVLRSSFKKTIIIYTASIIEALLLWLLKKEIKNSEIELKDVWKYNDIKVIYKLTDGSSCEVVAGIRKKEVKKLNNLDFFAVSRFCLDHNIITRNTFDNVDKVRKLRNKLHIGGLANIDRKYTDKDLKFVFGVAKDIKIIASEYK
ncbi:hypothetical protein KKG48_03270 [Patescibacteria group bacterium]|nr:hypothetical protein [Patescibacteria group bacterium]MCG2695047.1 hypothetical protein [Candidatus Parcubacteria bacterium]